MLSDILIHPEWCPYMAGYQLMPVEWQNQPQTDYLLYSTSGNSRRAIDGGHRFD